MARDGLRGDAARAATSGTAAHAIRDQHDRRETRPPILYLVRIRQAGTVHDHLRMDRAQEEVVLILLSHLPGMRNAEQVEILVARTRINADGGVTDSDLDAGSHG
jgi:hypothetical protein